MSPEDPSGTGDGGECWEELGGQLLWGYAWSIAPERVCSERERDHSSSLRGRGRKGAMMITGREDRKWQHLGRSL